MKVFLSYTSRDREKIGALQSGLHSLGCSVWLDQELTGGQRWWDRILQQIRECDAVLVAVSPALTSSEACRRETDYAQRLSKPVLPVMVETVGADVLPPWLATLQIVDFRAADGAAAFSLAGAINQLPNAPDLPDPLPDPPPVPLSYLGELAERIRHPNLSLDEQLAIVGKLKMGLSKPGERDAILGLITEFNDRDDLFRAAARELDSLVIRESAGPSETAATDSLIPDESLKPASSGPQMEDRVRNTAVSTHPPTNKTSTRIAVGDTPFEPLKRELGPPADGSRELFQARAIWIALAVGGAWVGSWSVLYLAWGALPAQTQVSLGYVPWWPAVVLGAGGILAAFLLQRLAPSVGWPHLALLAGSWPVLWLVWGFSPIANRIYSAGPFPYEAFWLSGILVIAAASSWSILRVTGKPRPTSVLLLSAVWTGAWLVFGSPLSIWQETVAFNQLSESLQISYSPWLLNAGTATGAAVSGLASGLLIYRYVSKHGAQAELPRR